MHHDSARSYWMTIDDEFADTRYTACGSAARLLSGDPSLWHSALDVWRLPIAIGRDAGRQRDCAVKVVPWNRQATKNCLSSSGSTCTVPPMNVHRSKTRRSSPGPTSTTG